MSTPSLGRPLVSGLLASAALISAWTVASRVAGFARQLVFSGSVGAACVGDTYNTANLLPTVLFEVAAGGALSATLVPLLAPLLPDRARDAERLASAVLTWTVVLLAPLMLALLALAGPLARAMVPTEDCPGQRALAAAMIGVFAPQVVLYGVGAVLAGLLQAAGRFAWPAFAPLLSSLVVMAGYLGYAAVVGDRAATMTGTALPGRAFVALAWGTTAGVAVMTLPLLVPLHRGGFRLRPRLRMPPGTGARVARLAGSGVLAVLAQQAFLLAVVWLANYRGRSGTLVAFGYTQALTVLPHAVLVAPLVTALFPRLARSADGPAGRGPRGAGGFAPLTARALRSVLLAGTAGAVLLGATAPAVAGLFEALDRGDVGPMSAALLAAAPGLVGFAVVVLAGRALYALEAPGAAAAGTSVTWLAAVVLAAAGVLTAPPDQALLALCAGQSAAMLFGGLVMLAVLRRRSGPTVVAGLVRTAALALPAGVVATALGWGLARWLLRVWPAGIVPSLAAAALAAAAAASVLAVPLVGQAADLTAGGGPDDGTEDGSGGGPDDGGVLLVLGPSSGGIARHVRSLARDLRAAGRHAVVAAPTATLAAAGFAEDGTPGRRLEIGDRPNPLRDLAAVRRLRRLVAGRDVVHAHGLRAGALSVLAARRSPVPVVVTVHNALVGGGPGQAAGPSGRVAGLVHRVLEEVVVRGAARVLVVSGDLGERMRALGARGVDRALVPAPVRVPSTASTLADRDAVRSRVRAGLGVPDGTALLVTVARLAPQKGLEVLLDAVAQLTQRPPRSASRTAPGPPVRCVVAGDGPLRDALAADIAVRGLPVLLAGRRDDVPDLLLAADLVIVPSLWEGQPLVVQEALRAGAAIVATDSGGTGEVTADAARLVPARDPAALAEAVRGLLADPAARRRLQALATRRAAELPTDTQALEQVLGVYDRSAADRLEPRGAAHA